MAPSAVESLHRRWLHLEEVGTDAHTDEAHWSRLKEHCSRRFLEAFKLLHDAPAGEHCWCNFEKVMDLLLEPFSFYFEQPQSDLHALWRRLRSELNACTKCVIASHESKDKYRKDYDEAHVEPLLNVLQLLDEERVATHLETLLNVVHEEKFDSTKHTMEVITVLFEVLMFPSLLEDAEVSERFAPFLQYVEDTHDLALAKGPQYPVQPFM